LFDDCPMDSRFSLLLKDFSETEGWRQVVQLNLDEMKATLRALAKFHAFFWNGLPRNQKLISSLWPVGSYLDQAKQPLIKVEDVSATFRRVVSEFVGTETLTGDLKDYGAILAKHAERLDREVHGGDKQTVIHGDAKSANFFYRRNSSGDIEVGVIDFQWTGLGLCATDLAYAIWACPQADVLDKEEELVETYYQYLIEELGHQGETGGQGIVELDTVKHQYRLAFIDLCRVIMVDHWKSVTLDTLRTRAGMPDNKKKVFNAYNKDEEVARRLVKKLMKDLDYLDTVWQ